MGESGTRSDDVTVKIALLGSPGAGKSTIVKAMAEAFAHSSVRAGELGEGRVFRTEFFWPDALTDGRRMRVRLFALSGSPVYNAVGELVLKGADGIVFAASLSQQAGLVTRDAWQAMIFNAARHGLDLTKLPVAMHYQHANGAPAGTPEQMDQWLGIPPGSLPRFVTGGEGGCDLQDSVKCVITELARRRDTAPAEASVS